MEMKDFLENRLQRIAFMIEATTKRIIKKEFKKLKRDLIKSMLKKLC